MYLNGNGSWYFCCPLTIKLITDDISGYPGGKSAGTVGFL